MSISERLFEVTAGMREQANAYVAKATAMAEQAADTARDSVAEAARKVEQVNTPVETLAAAGYKFNSLSHQAAERLLEQQFSFVKGFVDEGAERLRMLAKAADLQSAMNQQMAYFDATRERLTRDARGTYAILSDAGREARELATSTYSQLMSQPSRRKPAAAKAAAASRAKARATTVRARKGGKAKARKAA